jgi:hypothetical protein
MERINYLSNDPNLFVKSFYNDNVNESSAKLNKV